MRQISDIDEGTIRRVDWQELVPPTLLFRAFSATFKPSFLLLGSFFVALLSIPLGLIPKAPRKLIDLMDEAANATSIGGGAPLFPELSDYAPNLTFAQIEICPSSSFALGAIVFAVVAIWFALAVSRTTVVKLTSSSRSSTFASLKFATKKFKSILLPVLLPCMFFASIFIFSILVYKLGTFGEICAPIWVLCSLALLVLLLVSVLAIPFSMTAIAAENSDCFDAISRGISYATQRLLFCIFYYAFAFILTFIGWIVVEGIAEACLDFFCGTYFGDDGSWLDFWRFVVILLPSVYCALSFVVYSNAIYILLRRSVDGTPCDSCVLDLSGRKPLELRRILQDGKGAPEFDSETAKNNQVASGSETQD